MVLLGSIGFPRILNKSLTLILCMSMTWKIIEQNCYRCKSVRVFESRQINLNKLSIDYLKLSLFYDLTDKICILNPLGLLFQKMKIFDTLNCSKIIPLIFCTLYALYVAKHYYIKIVTAYNSCILLYFLFSLLSTKQNL